MVAMERGLELHGRSCRGGGLTGEERAELETWYADMDAEEARSVKIPQEVSPSLDELRAILDAELRMLQESVQETIKIRARNEALRQEIADLKQRFTEKQLVSAQ